MIEFFEEVIEIAERGDRVAIATLVARRGSAPGALGSKMLVRADGSSRGSIGGGCVEADVWQACMDAQKSGRPALLSFRLTAAEAAEGGLICGGTVKVLVEPVTVGQAPLYRRVVEALSGGTRVALGTLLPSPAGSESDGREEVFASVDKALWLNGTGRSPVRGSEPAPGSAALSPADAAQIDAQVGDTLAGGSYSGVRVLEAGAPAGDEIAPETGSAKMLVEIFAPRSTVYIFGAGHLSKEIAPLARHVGFRVVVIDDRAFFVNREAFPEADELLVAEFEDVVAGLPIDGDSYLVIVTRGHQHDGVVLEQALRVEPQPAYVGMIGSRSKVAALKKAIERAGIPREKLDAVHAPIGLSIAAKTPEEIAVSIVAELIGERGRQAAS